MEYWAIERNSRWFRAEPEEGYDKLGAQSLEVIAYVYDFDFSLLS